VGAVCRRGARPSSGSCTATAAGSRQRKWAVLTLVCQAQPPWLAHESVCRPQSAAEPSGSGRRWLVGPAEAALLIAPSTPCPTLPPTLQHRVRRLQCG
jgi:hypothetical protein